MVEESIYRKYVEEAVRILRPFQGKKTPFLYIGKKDFYRKNTACSIPLYENALFALLLLRKKTHEEMNEGKNLLQRILCKETACRLPNLKFLAILNKPKNI